MIFRGAKKEKAMKVGFIGLGQMGEGMAASLMKAGHELTVYNRTREKAAALAKEGAKVAANVAEACQGDAVITMLANDEAVSGVVFGGGGVLASLRKGAMHISSSTIGATLPAMMTAAHAEAGQRFIIRARFRQARRCRQGTAFHRGRRGAGDGEGGATSPRCDGPENLRHLRDAQRRQSREA